MNVAPRRFVLLLVSAVATATASEPVVIKESDIVFPGFLGFGRRVDSETLILPSAPAVLVRQHALDRREALREAHDVAAREQERQAAARRKAEADAMASVEPSPGDAAGAEAAMVEASNQPVLENVATPAAAVAEEPVTSPTTGEASRDQSAPEAAAPAEALPEPVAE